MRRGVGVSASGWSDGGRALVLPQGVAAVCSSSVTPSRGTGYLPAFPPRFMSASKISYGDLMQSPKRKTTTCGTVAAQPHEAQAESLPPISDFTASSGLLTHTKKVIIKLTSSSLCVGLSRCQGITPHIILVRWWLWLCGLLCWLGKHSEM